MLYLLNDSKHQPILSSCPRTFYQRRFNLICPNSPSKYQNTLNTLLIRNWFLPRSAWNLIEKQHCFACSSIKGMWQSREKEAIELYFALMMHLLQFHFLVWLLLSTVKWPSWQAPTFEVDRTWMSGKRGLQSSPKGTPLLGSYSPSLGTILMHSIIGQTE